MIAWGAFIGGEISRTGHEVIRFLADTFRAGSGSSS